MTIRFNELLDYDLFPQAGKHNYYSSKVIDLEFVHEGSKYYIKCHIDFKYWRWFYPETHWGPKEDECELIHLIIQPIKGYKVHTDESEVNLSEKDLRRLKEKLESEIIFL